MGTHTSAEEVAEAERDMTMIKTAGETEMLAAASNNCNNSAELYHVVWLDNSVAGDWAGT
jgi:hypothetical protein